MTNKPLGHLKIALLIHSLRGGGAERVTIGLAARWAQQGADVLIATLAPAEESKYSIPDGVKFVSLEISGSSNDALSAILNNIRRLWRLRQLLREEQPDVVVGMMTTMAVMLALVRPRGILAIGAERNYPARQAIGRYWGLLRRWFYRRLDVITVQTREGRDWLLNHTRAREVLVIPNSVQLPLPVSEPILAVDGVIANGRKMLLAVGRLAQQKSFDRLIRAFAELSQRYEQWDLVILGEGELRPQMESQIKSLGLEGRVKLPGWAGNAGDWYRAADLFAMVSAFEGFPNALIEAMAHGCPVIAVDCDTGPRDIIKNGHNGVLIPQDDELALKASLENLMIHDKLRNKLSENAIFVIEEFSENRIITQWESLFINRIYNRKKAVLR